MIQPETVGIGTPSPFGQEASQDPVGVNKTGSHVCTWFIRLTLGIRNPRHHPATVGDRWVRYVRRRRRHDRNSRCYSACAGCRHAIHPTPPHSPGNTKHTTPYICKGLQRFSHHCRNNVLHKVASTTSTTTCVEQMAASLQRCPSRAAGELGSTAVQPTILSFLKDIDATNLNEARKHCLITGVYVQQ